MTSPPSGHAAATAAGVVYRIFIPRAESTSSVPSTAVSVLYVERRVHLDEVERAEEGRVGNHFHHHVRFAVVEAALDRRADAGRDRRIADVEIERHVDAGGAASDQPDRAFGDRGDARAIDVLHREDVDARVAHERPFRARRGCARR